MRESKHYVISGQVQGVGFRYFTEYAASRLGVDGWVRNMPDGCVEVEAAAESTELNKFEHAIRIGPPGARVSDVAVTILEEPLAAGGFRIR